MSDNVDRGIKLPEVKQLKLWAQKVTTKFELKASQFLELSMLIDASATTEVIQAEKAAKAVANIQWQAYIQTKRFRKPTSAFSKKKWTPPLGDSKTGGWAMVHQDLEDDLDNIVDQDGVSSPSGSDFEPEGQEEDNEDDKIAENGSDTHPLMEASKVRTKLVKATHEGIMQACQSIDSETYSGTSSREKCKAPAGGMMPGLTAKKHNSGMADTQASVNCTPKTPLANGLKPEFHSSKANRQSKSSAQPISYLSQWETTLSGLFHSKGHPSSPAEFNFGGLPSYKDDSFDQPLSMTMQAPSRRQDEALEQQPTAKVILGAPQNHLSQSSVIMNAVTSSKSCQAPSNLDLPAGSQHIFVTQFVPILWKYIGMRENPQITDALIEPIQVLLDALMVDWPHKFSDENDLIVEISDVSIVEYW
ncbi:hypothetical protein F5J12DRAFT_899412 [Pisolithus orientalis]|uniref:uncharacterized protein n=1 Tax=Pisolithus orientalis TaxID=936130 RepID=UPI00222498F5|nr:uncharacterized protein F5J12DRAFT_899412 [Pisolithus orientalis]KAI5983989.1 hypothetical protein F5J12DRAFT_899412 [Pisolithus orientalis]